MYCSKCRYTSFDHLEKCPKCGQVWSEEKKKLGMEWLKSGDKGWLEPGLFKKGDQETVPDMNLEDSGDFAFHQEQDDTGSKNGIPLDVPEKDDQDMQAGTTAPELEIEIDPGFDQLEPGISEDKAEPPLQKTEPEPETAYIDPGFEISEHESAVEEPEFYPEPEEFELDHAVTEDNHAGQEPTLLGVESEPETALGDPGLEMPEHEERQDESEPELELIDPGLEPELDLHTGEENEEKDKPDNTASEHDQEYEIEYPDLEFIDPDDSTKNKK